MTEDDIFYMADCQDYALRSPDPSRKTGATIVNRRGEITARGRNHFPFGISCTDARLERPAKYKWIEHAERDAIYSAARRGIRTAGSRMYLTWYPCADCARAIIQAAIVELICREPDWSDPRWAEDFSIVNEMLSEARVAVRFVGKFEERAA